MCSSATSLTSFKVSFSGCLATFTGLKNGSIHSQTHRTARLTPFKTGIAEYSIQSFLFCRLLDRVRPWNNQSVHGGTLFIALYHAGCSTEICDSCVGT